MLFGFHGGPTHLADIVYGVEQEEILHIVIFMYDRRREPYSGSIAAIRDDLSGSSFRSRCVFHRNDQAFAAQFAEEMFDYAYLACFEALEITLGKSDEAFPGRTFFDRRPQSRPRIV